MIITFHYTIVFLHDIYTNISCNRSYNHPVACVTGPFSLKSQVSCKLCNLKCTVHLISCSFRRSTAHEDNRDLRFDLGRYWIKVARLKGSFCQIYWNFSRMREGNENKEKEKTKNLRMYMLGSVNFV